MSYNTVNFGECTQKNMKARALSLSDATLEVRLNTPDSPVICEMKIPSDKEWTTISAPVSNLPKGVHNLYLTLTGGTYLEIDWISFE
ncbi:MAG: carbohydrate-binding protein [Bacteroides sp.]|nr:carbohydrate-binding protein [Bacteroides sp.]